MKILLTIVVNSDIGTKNAPPLYDGIEIICPEENESEKDLLTRAIKTAKGKYTVLSDRKFRLADINSLLNILDKNSADMVSFTGGTAIKTNLIKNALKDCTDIFSCLVLSVIGCKTVLKSLYTPFSFEKYQPVFSEDNNAGILLAAEVFCAEKAALSKEVYSYCLNTLCNRLITYYLYTMLAIKCGEVDGEELVKFDGRLKSEIVLYLALEKNFTAAKLSKLRKKNFKISYFTAKKFKKILNIK